ncbi:MAG: RluA family pseudouridine synthase [Rhodobacteraceae bacterium]|jgi:23S rRNA pseudouridine1911/1915/1917 synthase|nr:RluA family pseudouridine synthase [Paracoccaceae bacterium]
MAPSLLLHGDAGGRVALVTIGADPPARLDRALARDLPAEGPAAGLSRSRLARLIADGAVSRGGTAVTDPAARVAPGEVLALRLDPPAPVQTPAQPIPLAVVWEDDELIVIDKQAGLVTHPAPGSSDGTLVNALLHHCGGRLAGIGGQARPGIVHRLDKDTSGLLVAAKSDRAHAGLAAQFAARSVERRYLALVHGVPDAADPRLAGMPGVSFEPGGVLRIALPIGRHPGDRQRQAVVGGGRAAVTRARVLRRFGVPPCAALLECRLETGRTHQIRVHLAHAGHGLIGDPVYGGRRRLSAAALPAGAADAAAAFPRQALHAATLGFVHPVGGQRLAFASPVPADMAGLAAALAGDDKG